MKSTIALSKTLKHENAQSLSTDQQDFAAANKHFCNLSAHSNDKQVETGTNRNQRTKIQTKETHALKNRK